MKSSAKLVGLVLVMAFSGTPVVTGEKPKSGAGLLEEATGIKVDPVAFRTQVRSLARPFSGIIEGASDRILMAATTPAERIVALRLKVNAVPAIQGALFLSDPLAALFEVAGLLEQMEIYLAEGDGRSLPGLVRDEVMDAIHEMERRIRDLAAVHGVTEEVGARFWKRAEDWAREHPVTDSFVARETTQMLYAEHIKTEGGNLRGFARRLDENIHDLSLRFDLYAEYIAKQARWQAELLVEEGLVTGVPSRVVAEVGTIPVAIRELPVDLSAERAAVREALVAERRLLLDWGEAQRRAVESFIRSEREGLSALAEREREIVLRELRGEREVVLAAFDEQRGRLMVDLGELITERVERTGIRLIDHAAVRIAQLAAAGMIALFALSFIMLRFATAGSRS